MDSPEDLLPRPDTILQPDIIEISDDDIDCAAAQPSDSMPAKTGSATRDEMLRHKQSCFLAAFYRVKQQTWLDYVAKEMGMSRQDAIEIYKTIDPAIFENKIASLFPAQWATKGPPPPPPPLRFRIPSPRPPSSELITLPPPQLASSRRRHPVHNSRDEPPNPYNTKPGRFSGTGGIRTSVNPRTDEKNPRAEVPALTGYDYPLSLNMPCPGMTRTSEDNHALLTDRIFS